MNELKFEFLGKRTPARPRRPPPDPPVKKDTNNEKVNNKSIFFEKKYRWFL